MSTLPKRLRILTFTVLAIPLIQACQNSNSGATLTAEAGVDTQQTQAALVQQTQAVIVQQTQAVVKEQTQTAEAAQFQQTALPATTPTPLVLSVPTESQPVFTTPAAPVITLQLGAIGITYGQKLSSFPKSQHILYVFNGTQGDSVTILLESSVLGANRNSCINLPLASTTFVLKTPNTQLRSTNQSTQFSYLRDYLLPDSGAYYIDVSCSGRLCSCTQADLSLEKK